MIRVTVTDSWGRIVDIRTDANYNPDACDDMTARALRILNELPVESGEIEWDEDTETQADPAGLPVIPEFTEPYPGTQGADDDAEE